MPSQKLTGRSPKKWRARLANFFGATAYLVLAVEWVVALALYIPLLELLPKPDRTPNPEALAPTQAVVDSGSQLLTFAFMAIVVTVMIGVTIFVMAKLPLAIARTGRKAVKGSSDVVAHALLKVTRRKETKKRWLTLLPKVMLALKLAAVLLPIGLAYGSYLLPGEKLEPSIAIFGVAILADVALVLVALQLVAGRLLKVARTDLW